MAYQRIEINPESAERSGGSVLVIYTGGTLGMVYDVKGRQLVPFNFDQVVERVPEMQRLDFAVTFLSLEKPIDSSNMTPGIWIELATIIEQEYDQYDSFVILHGTDTMAYTASALSYLLEGLNKCVILTGAQLPIGVARSDARENFLTALEIATAKTQNGNPIVSEVCVFFNSRLLRGNRSKKQESSDFDAFHSENYPIMANAGVRIEFYYPFLKPYNPAEKLNVRKALDTQITFLKVFPGITYEVVNAVFNIPGLKGIVLETYGAGNAPTEEWFLNAVKEAIDREVIIFNVSQCNGGRVNQGQYETSKFLGQVGVVSGSDITIEAAITKMMYILAKESDHNTRCQLLSKPIRGEMSVE